MATHQLERPTTAARRVPPPLPAVRGGAWQAPPPGLAAAAGIDFASVRLHTDQRAGASALALGAAAYTVGRDIVFAPGAYQPETHSGRQLIAHEMTHVQQQQGQAYTGGPLQLESPTSSAEHEAQAAAQGEATAAPRRGGGVRVQRSLLGAGLGGLLGGGIGAAIGIGLGSLLGPVGMVVGGILGGLGGLVGGAILGDLASRRSRSLSGPEQDYLEEIYHDSVDMSQVTITRGSALAAGAARTTGNTINLQDEHFDGDTMDLSDAGLLVLAHEMGHVWQYQNGGLAYIPSSLVPQAVAALTGGDRNAAYDWRAMVRSKVPWEQWNAEQQAECISDYNAALRNCRGANPQLKDYETVTLAEPYIALVRQRFGAPGSQRRRPGASRTAAAEEGT